VLRRKIEKMKQCCIIVAAVLVSAWSLVLIPRFGLKSVIEVWRRHEMGGTSKGYPFPLGALQFPSFRLHTTAAKHKCDVVEIGRLAQPSTYNSRTL
jgi:hypothetical protein